MSTGGIFRDPRGYYATLGVDPSVDEAALKAAYRKKAKELHPDHNPRPTAQEEFQRLNEAYHLLLDPRKRRAYDALTRPHAGASASGHARAGGAGSEDERATAGGASATTGGASGGRASAGSGHSASAAAGRSSGAAGYTASGQASGQGRTAGGGRDSASAFSAGHGASSASSHRGAAAYRRPASAPPTPPQCCQRCGKLAAQPRYVVFPQIRGRLLSVWKGTVEGVFCRRCSDILALQSAVKIWVLGWWALPFGPFFTLSALMALARGGQFPRERNFTLLLRQARAFLARHDKALAHGLALQARGYADNDTEKALADAVLKVVPSAGQGRVLKNRWQGTSGWRLAQMLPPLLLALGLWLLVPDRGLVLPWDEPALEREAEATSPSLRPPTSLEGVQVEGLDRPALLRTNRLYEVTAPRLVMRTGPGAHYKDILELEAGSMVLVLENAPEGGWVRVLTADSAVGFVAGRYLTPGLPNRSLDGSIIPPGNGTVPSLPLPGAMRGQDGAPPAR